MQTITFSRLPDVVARFGFARSTVYNRVFAKLLPPPVPLGGRAVAWPNHELDAVAAAMLAGKSDKEIRELVTRLEEGRKVVSQVLEAA